MTKKNLRRDADQFGAPSLASVSGEQKLRTELLEWFRKHARKLPWRRRSGPYEVLVSEVMLQQTRLDTVIPYYGRFLSEFPTVDSLAEAPIEKVLSLWSGLGYYRRARHLHAAAKQVVEKGGFPRSERELRRLPGVGAYTAAAVASISFGEPVAVLDGNVERVVGRLIALSADPKRKQARLKLLAKATELLDRGAPGDSNQALMEIGATVCSPLRPRCSECPLGRDCLARASGHPEAYPPRRESRRPIVEKRIVVVVETKGRILLCRNSDDEKILAGLWELPWTKRSGERKAGWELALAQRYGGTWSLGRKLGEARHHITFRDLRLEIRRARVVYEDDVVAESEAGEMSWRNRQELSSIPTSSMIDKVLDQADGGAERGRGR